MKFYSLKFTLHEDLEDECNGFWVQRSLNNELEKLSLIGSRRIA